MKIKKVFNKAHKKTILLLLSNNNKKKNRVKHNIIILDNLKNNKLNSKLLRKKNSETWNLFLLKNIDFLFIITHVHILDRVSMMTKHRTLEKK